MTEGDEAAATQSELTDAAALQQELGCVCVCVSCWTDTRREKDGKKFGKTTAKDHSGSN